MSSYGLRQVDLVEGDEAVFEGLDDGLGAMDELQLGEDIAKALYSYRGASYEVINRRYEAMAVYKDELEKLMGKFRRYRYRVCKC